MRAFVFLLFCQLSFTSLWGQSSLYRHYTVNEGLPGNLVYGILQDSKGYMWFGTENGVCRFDGKTFITYTHRDGLTDNTVLNIYEDKKGRIWFLTLNGRLCYWYREQFFNASNDTLLSRLPHSRHYSIPEEDQEGNLYFTSTANVTFKLADNTITDQSENLLRKIEQNVSDSFYRADVFGIFEHFYTVGTGQYFVRHRDSTSYFLFKHTLYENGTSIRPIYRNEQLPYLAFNYFVTLGEDFWICTKNGVFQVAGFKSKKPVLRKFLEGKKVNMLYRDREGNLWFSTDGEGLFFYSAHLRPANAFKPGFENISGHIRTLHLDKQGVIWAGGEKNQVFRIDEKGCRKVILKGAHSEVAAVYDILHGADDRIYIATDDRLIRLDPNTFYQQSLRLMRDGKRLDVSNFKSLSDGPGKSVMATTSHLLYFYKPGTDLARKGLISLVRPGENQRIFTAYQARNGRIWVANNEGLSTLYGNILIPFLIDSLQLSEPISRIIETKDAKLVVATRSKGLYLIDRNKCVQVFSESDGLASDICNQISIFGDTILVSTVKGVSLLRYDGKLRWVRNYTLKDGLLAMEVTDAVLKNDTLYISGAEGISIVPMAGSERTAAPPLYITGVFYGKESIDPSNAQISYLNNYLQIHFVAITFQQPEAIEYRYRLTGTDNNWHKNKSGIVDYPDLQPGAYTFEVQAKKYDSDWSKIETFTFRIQAPFWMENWFYALCFGVVLALVFVFISLLLRRERIRKLRKLGVQNRMIQLEQQALSALMNPHFIFNALNSIQHYLHENDTLAANKYLSLFARLTRKNMEAVMKVEISLEDELERLELYLNFEKLRFGNKLNYQILIPDHLDMDDFMIPPMVLQPFVENAIWHGLMPKNEGGNIRVAVQKGSASKYTIEIIDDGIGIEVSKELKHNQELMHTSLGMQMTFERLELWAKLKGKTVHIDIEQVCDEQGKSLGTRVFLLLPFG
ncbi:MAG: two-component regulator propeller domain-containing protein [Bacteroidia bacterium]